MANIALRIDNGLNTSGDPLRLGPGFLRVCEGAIYMPDDPDRPHKHPGRTEAGVLPAAATTANTKGLAFLQYENADDKFVLLANSQFYQVTAATSGILAGDWADVADAQSTPVAFPRTGSYLKAIPDGDNGWIMWTGASERAIIREQGGHSWFLGLKRPLPLTVSKITIAPTDTVPDSSSSITTEFSFNGNNITPTKTWQNPSNAFDTDIDTFALANLVDIDPATTLYATELYEFTDAGTIPANFFLFVTFDTISSTPAQGLAELTFQVSYNNGSTFTTVHTFTKPVSSFTQHNIPNLKQVAVIPLTSGGTWVDFQIRVVGSSSGAITQHKLYEMVAHLDTEGGSATINAGIYNYAYTEVFEVTGGKRPRTIESLPSDVIKITADGTEFGMILTFNTDDAVVNEDTDGVKDDPNNNLKHYRKVYRTTKTGVYPDLGFIGIAPINALTYTDDFAISGETLGSPPLNVVYERDIPVEAAGFPPNFRDAVYFKGVIIIIPEDDPFKIIWSMPGQPHYYPVSHGAKLIPTNRNDELKGVTAIGDSIIVFSRTMVHRVRILPIVDRPNFSTQTMEIVPLSPNEGLAGGPLSHTLAYSQKGHAIVLWVSDNGIWMTDGSLVSEGGMGIAKLSIFMDWKKEIDISQLSETKLTYDSILQIVIFEYIDNDGATQVKYLHMGPHHWVQTGQDQAVPKTSGPHTQFALKQRVFGEIASKINQWSLDTTNLRIYNERTGTDLSGSPIVTHIESGLNYLQGSENEFHAYEGAFLHSNWGPSETCELEIRTLRDTKGIAQVLHKNIRLNGERETDFFINRGGQAMQVTVRHEGNTISDGSATRAFGPLTLDVAPLGEVES